MDEELSIEHFITNTLNTAKQKFIGDIAAGARPILDKFNKDLQSFLLTRCQTWLARNSQGAMPVLPDNVKYYTKVGSIQIIVLEYKPQVRSLLMMKSLMDRVPVYVSDAEKLDCVPIALALPYVILTLSFSLIDNKLLTLRVHYRNSPLTSLKDMLYFTNLPNVNGCEVCMGKNYLPSSHSIHTQVPEIVSYFWQSSFNRDYSYNYSKTAATIPSLRTLRQWHQSSIDDPLFVLKVPWTKHVTLEDFIVSNNIQGGDPGLQTELEKQLKDVTDKVATFFEFKFNVPSAVRAGMDLLEKNRKECELLMLKKKRLEEEISRLEKEIPNFLEKEIYKQRDNSSNYDVW